MAKLRRAPTQAFAFARLAPTGRSVIRKRLTYLSPVKMLALQLALQAADARGTQGSIVEFGVALGGSAIALTRESPDRDFHGFDLFGMIPPPDTKKDGQRAVDRYQVIAQGESAGIRGDDYYGYMPDLLGVVHDSFARFGVPVDGQRRHLHKGLFEESWPAVASSVKSVAVAHIDCDWHAPVAYCLKHIAPLIAPNGFVILDDYFDYEGCRSATDEFLELPPEFEVWHRGENLSLRRVAAS